VTSFARFRAARVAGDWVFLGTSAGTFAANLAGGLYQSSDKFDDGFVDAGAVNCDDPVDGGLDTACQPIPDWNEVKAPDNEFDLGFGSEVDPVVGFASLSNDFLFATKQMLFLDFGPDELNPQLAGVQTVIPVLELGKEADGNSLSSQVTALASFGGNVYLGTEIGIYQVDLVAAGACKERNASSECLLKSLSKLEGFPTVKIKAFATGADRFFALTEDGLYELRSTRPQVNDPTTTAAIDGVTAIYEDGGFVVPRTGFDGGGAGMDGGSGGTVEDDAGGPGAHDAGPDGGGLSDAGSDPCVEPESGLFPDGGWWYPPEECFVF
jgi:hypothetical protein